MAGRGGGHQAPVCRGSTIALAECSRAHLPFRSCRLRPVRQVSWGFFPLILKESDTSGTASAHPTPHGVSTSASLRAAWERASPWRSHASSVRSCEQVHP